MKTIGEKIAIARKNQNMSQTDVAGRVGITPQMVSKWERDESLPDVIMLKRLSEIFNVSVLYFYDEADFETKTYSKESEAEEKAKKRKSRIWLNEQKWFCNDFSETSMKDLDFAYAKFSNCNLKGCDISETSLNYTEFQSCNLSNSNLQNTKMFRADIKLSNLSGANLSETFLDKSDFTMSNFKEANFCNAAMEETAFVFCSFHMINFENVTIKGCGFKNNTFINCKFSNTIFDKCKFKDTTFKNCIADKIAYNFLLSCRANIKGIEVL